MRKITMTLMVLAITLTASAQTAVDDLIAKLLKTYPQTPSREIIDKDPTTGKLLRHITEYSFRDIKQEDFDPLVNALRDSHNGYFTNTYTRKQTHESDSCVYELHTADADPDFSTVYILQTMGRSDAPRAFTQLKHACRSLRKSH
ncbi:MAG: hypothetical protein IJ570_01305 [Prevotella sp.]|nr:hypothetical protein [Prevotella sp.]